MKLSELKTILPQLHQISFKLENGTLVPSHFHLTELGFIEKRFVDCGGTVRFEKSISLQLWTANDIDHRFQAEKWLSILTRFELELALEDVEIEVEYQQETIGKFNLAFDGHGFILLNKKTACLAEDQCGIPSQKPRIRLSDLTAASEKSCSPGSGCC